jgi:hypothetical protein
MPTLSYYFTFFNSSLEACFGMAAAADFCRALIRYLRSKAKCMGETWKTPTEIKGKNFIRVQPVEFYLQIVLVLVIASLYLTDDVSPVRS